jgi:hypothetical protein
LVAEAGDLKRGIEAMPVATTGNITPASIGRAKALGPDLPPDRARSAAVRILQV